LLDRRSTGARLLALRSFGKLIQPVRSRSSQAGEIQRPGESGLDQQMIDEVKKFAAAETANGSTGMRSILQAVTWFIQQRWSDHAAVAALVALAGPGMQFEASAECMPKLAVGRTTRLRFGNTQLPRVPGVDNSNRTRQKRRLCSYRLRAVSPPIKGKGKERLHIKVRLMRLLRWLK
jgi:hypothetical protein